MPAPRPLPARLLDRVDVRGVDECWEWAGALDRKGYGGIRADGPERRMLRAHRVSYEVLRGPIPPNTCVLHRCDNRRCVNPNHLWLGSIADNNADMVAKGRARGGRSGGRKR